MSISKRDASQYIARVRRHYNLTADEIIAVDTFAMMLTGAKLYGGQLTVGLTADAFKKVCKHPLENGPSKEYVVLLPGVIARKANPAEFQNKRWMSYCWSVTRDYLIHERNNILLHPKTDRKRQEQVQAELKLLNIIDATVPVTSNKAKALQRLNQAIAITDVNKEDVVLVDQTIPLILEDIKSTHDIIVFAIPFVQLERLRKNPDFPPEKEFFTNTTMVLGHEVLDNTYVVAINAPLHKKVRDARDRYSTGNTPFTYYSFEYV